MREILTLQIGGAGNSVGDEFWQHISHEHCINYDTGCFCGCNYLQLERTNVFFNRTITNRFYARTIAIDTDCMLGEKTSSALYNPANVIMGSQSAANNFAKGFLTDGALYLEDILDVVRREVEGIDCLQGFHLIHSIGGGTGSGLASLIMTHLVEDYPDNLIANYVIIPSKQLSSVVVEPYNALLSMPALLQFSHLSFVLDNQAAFNICCQKMRQCHSNYSNINHLIALTISGITSCLRFPGQLNSGLRKIYVNMVPFPSLHFLVTSFAPLQTCAQMRYLRGDVAELVQSMFSSYNLLCEIQLKDGKVLTAAGIFRGKISPREVDELMTNVIEENSSIFVDWIPNNIKTAICDVPPIGLNISSTFIGNATAIDSLFIRMNDSASGMLKQRAHLHWFLGEGMEEDEFHHAQESMMEVISNYQSAAT